MSGAVTRKRRSDDSSRPKPDRFVKKRKRQSRAYHSDSDSVENDDDDNDQPDFQAVSLLDSDDEALDDAIADDGAASDSGSESEDSLDSLSDGGAERRKPTKTAKTAKAPRTNTTEAADGPSDSESDDDASSDDSDAMTGNRPGAKSKRNDPSTFSTSLQKILGTKLSLTRRSDPVLSRSADAREASRRIVDAALEEKARRQMRLERRAALEKGRVKDVLIASNAGRLTSGLGSSAGGGGDGEQETTAKILETERRLRKVAQRGVVQLFNAVRAAQVKAAQAKKRAKTEGILGMDKRDAKVTEMSRKGFLDLIASGGGGLKKGGLEEA